MRNRNLNNSYTTYGFNNAFEGYLENDPNLTHFLNSINKTLNVDYLETDTESFAKRINIEVFNNLKGIKFSDIKDIINIYMFSINISERNTKDNIFIIKYNKQNLQKYIIDLEDNYYSVNNLDKTNIKQVSNYGRNPSVYSDYKVYMRTMLENYFNDFKEAFNSITEQFPRKINLINRIEIYYKEKTIIFDNEKKDILSVLLYDNFDRKECLLSSEINIDVTTNKRINYQNLINNEEKIYYYLFHTFENKYINSYYNDMIENINNDDNNRTYFSSILKCFNHHYLRYIYKKFFNISNKDFDNILNNKNYEITVFISPYFKYFRFIYNFNNKIIIDGLQKELINIHNIKYIIDSHYFGNRSFHDCIHNNDYENKKEFHSYICLNLDTSDLFINHIDKKEFEKLFYKSGNREVIEPSSDIQISNKDYIEFNKVINYILNYILKNNIRRKIPNISSISINSEYINIFKIIEINYFKGESFTLKLFKDFDINLKSGQYNNKIEYDENKLKNIEDNLIDKLKKNNILIDEDTDETECLECLLRYRCLDYKHFEQHLNNDLNLKHIFVLVKYLITDKFKDDPDNENEIINVRHLLNSLHKAGKQNSHTFIFLVSYVYNIIKVLNNSNLPEEF